MGQHLYYVLQVYHLDSSFLPQQPVQHPTYGVSLDHLPPIIHGLLVLYSVFYDLFRCCWS
jgi:hypothetical protein